jgi:hypothetical protein
VRLVSRNGHDRSELFREPFRARLFRFRPAPPRRPRPAPLRDRGPQGAAARSRRHGRRPAPRRGRPHHRQRSAALRGGAPAWGRRHRLKAGRQPLSWRPWPRLAQGEGQRNRRVCDHGLCRARSGRGRRAARRQTVAGRAGQVRPRRQGFAAAARPVARRPCDPCRSGPGAPRAGRRDQVLRACNPTATTAAETIELGRKHGVFMVPVRINDPQRQRGGIARPPTKAMPSPETREVDWRRPAPLTPRRFAVLSLPL